MTETGRHYWMRVYAGMAMQALVGKGSFDETGLQRVDSLANRAVSISKAILDELRNPPEGVDSPQLPERLKAPVEGTRPERVDVSEN